MRPPGYLELSQLLKPRHLRGDVHLVGEISDLQSVGLTTVGEVQTVALKIRFQ